VQTHTSYPVLRSFHYEREYNALPRILHTCWETVTLLRTIVVVPAERAELCGSSAREIAASAEELCSRVVRKPLALDSSATQREQWLGDYARTRDLLRAAGVPVRDDAPEQYVEARTAWEAAVAVLAEQLLYEWDNTSPS
jgi:hypothetical protein